MTLTEREMLIAKIAITQGVVVCGKTTREEATKRLKEYAKTHFTSFENALKLEAEIDQMLGDSVLT